MALTIADAEVERLVAEIRELTGETRTEVVRQALLGRRSRLVARMTGEDRRQRIRRVLEREIWSRVPEEQLGSAPNRMECQQILGYGDEG